MVERIETRRDVARHHLEAAVERRERAYAELITSQDPVDQAIARVYRDFLLQAEQGVALEAIAAADREVVLTGPPGSGK
ncbi:MAG: hypothetical protein WD378_03540, partial [Egicoccus sp.]